MAKNHSPQVLAAADVLKTLFKSKTNRELEHSAALKWVYQIHQPLSAKSFTFEDFKAVLLEHGWSPGFNLGYVSPVYSFLNGSLFFALTDDSGIACEIDSPVENLILGLWVKSSKNAEYLLSTKELTQFDMSKIEGLLVSCDTLINNLNTTRQPTKKRDLLSSAGWVFQSDIEEYIDELDADFVQAFRLSSSNA